MNLSRYLKMLLLPSLLSLFVLQAPGCVSESSEPSTAAKVAEHLSTVEPSSEWFLFDFEFNEGDPSSEKNAGKLFLLQFTVNKELFKKDKNRKFHLSKSSYCDGNIASSMELIPAKDGRSASGHLTIRLLGHKSRIVSYKENYSVDSPEVVNLYYADEVVKDGVIKEISFLINITGDASGYVTGISFKKRPGSVMLKNRDSYSLGKVVDLFSGDKVDREVWLSFAQQATDD
jgi:hypothetical protein